MTLITGLYLKPEMEERLPLHYGLAVHINAYISVDGNRPNETFTTKTGHDYGNAVVSLQPTFMNSWHLTLLADLWLANAPRSPALLTVRCSVLLAIVPVHISNSTDRERPGSKHALKRGFGTFPEVYRLRKDIWSKSLPCYILSPR